MKHVTFYHKETGMLCGVSVLASDDSTIAANTPRDHVAIMHPAERCLDHLSQRVDITSGEVVDYRPTQPSSDHEWNAKTRRWVLSAAAAARMASIREASARLIALDTLSIRPLRALVLGIGSTTDKERLADIEKEAVELRALINVAQFSGSGASSA